MWWTGSIARESTGGSRSGVLVRSGHPAGVVDRVRLAGLSGRAVFGRAGVYGDERGRAVGQMSGVFRWAGGPRIGGRLEPWAAGRVVRAGRVGGWQATYDLVRLGRPPVIDQAALVWG